MPQLVRQGAQAEHVVGVGHHDEGACAHRAAGEGALALAFVAGLVHPALLEAAVAQDVDILLAQGCHAVADPLHRLLEGHDRLLRR